MASCTCVFYFSSYRNTIYLHQGITHQRIQWFQYFGNYCLFQIHVIRRSHWKLVYFFFFTLIKEINIILRLNLWKKTPSGLRKLCIQFAFEISDHYYSCLSRLKKPLLSLLAMKTFFVVVHETHLYLISKVTTAFFPPVCLLFMKKVHSIAGGGRLTNTCSGTDSTPFYLICTFFFLSYTPL